MLFGGPASINGGFAGARAGGDLADRQPEIALAREQLAGRLENSLLGLPAAGPTGAGAARDCAAGNRATYDGTVGRGVGNSSASYDSAPGRAGSRTRLGVRSAAHDPGLNPAGLC